MNAQVLKTIRDKVLLTILTVAIIVGLITAITKSCSDISEIKRCHLALLLFGFLLASLRAWWKDMNDARYKKEYRPKGLPLLLPTYLLNYPVFFISAYYLTIHTEWLVIPFLVGWSVDYLWEDGNIFSGLGKLFKKEG